MNMAANCQRDIRTSSLRFQRFPHRHVDRQESKAHKRKRERPFGTLGTISEGQDETHYQQANVKVFQDEVGYVNPLDTERGILHSVRQNPEGDVEVSLGMKPLGQDCNRLGGVRLTSANQEKMRLKT